MHLFSRKRHRRQLRVDDRKGAARLGDFDICRGASGERGIEGARGTSQTHKTVTHKTVRVLFEIEGARGTSLGKMPSVTAYLMFRCFRGFTFQGLEPGSLWTGVECIGCLGLGFDQP